MLGSLLRQLVSGLEGIPEVVVQTFRNERKVIGGRGLQVSGILEMFRTIIATKRTFICVDALDECVPEHRTIVLESLRQILQGAPNTRVFITGRSHVRNEVERKLYAATTFILIQTTEEGLIRYIQDKLRNDVFPDTMNPTLEADIMKSIPEISAETFLLASLHIGAILRETTIARRGKRLKLLKDGAGLEDAYGATLERIRSQNGEKTKLAIATLLWVCHAERPLLVDELCHALAVEIGETYFDPDNVPSMGALLSCCQGLITVDKEGSTVRLIHITVREYLCAHPNLFGNPHSTVTEACLTYLNSEQVRNLSSHPLPGHEAVPFLQYSSRYWGTHANRGLSDHARVLALELLSQYEDHVSAVSLLKQVLLPSCIGRIGNSPLFSGLHCASFFGNVELVTALITRKGCNINQGDCTNRAPLSWAARMGHEGVVKLLLGREDVDPDRPDSQGATPLLLAAYSGHGGVVKLLLGQEKVDPNCPDMSGLTPLGNAAFEGHEGVVKLLLAREVIDPNKPNNRDSTPLLLAAYRGHGGVVKLLLDRKDVDTNCPDEDDWTPLGWAAINGHEGAVKILLDREGVDPNRPDRNGRTPLGNAAFQGHEGVVKLLLAREVIDPDKPGNRGRTPLLLAAYRGHGGVVKLLLDHKDVDPNCPDEDDRTPLGWAALNGHEEAVKILLDREGVDPNRPGKNGRTPLGNAAFEGHTGVVKLLLELEFVNPHMADAIDCTPLLLAAFKGHGGVVKLLLDRKDVDPNRSDASNRTPLAWAALNGHGRVVKLLLEREGIDPNKPDKNGGTPLFYATRENHKEVVKLLQAQNSVECRDAQPPPA